MENHFNESVQKLIYLLLRLKKKIIIIITCVGATVSFHTHETPKSLYKVYEINKLMPFNRTKLSFPFQNCLNDTVSDWGHASWSVAVPSTLNFLSLSFRKFNFCDVSY